MASTYPAEFFAAHPLQNKAGYCFVLMPFDESMREIYAVVKETMEGPPWNFSCKRADDFFGGGHILTHILKGIAEAEILVADLTGRNPNVFYELGIAHMWRDPRNIILLTQSMDSVPFDLRGFRCITYSQTIQGARKLKEDLSNALREVTHPVYPFTVQKGDTYQFPKRLPGDDRCLYDLSIRADYLGENFAKLVLAVRQYVAGEPQPRQLAAEGCGLGTGEIQPVPHIPWDLMVNSCGPESATLSLVYRLEQASRARA